MGSFFSSQRDAAICSILLLKGKPVEVPADDEPSLCQAAEWWKQRYSERDRKDQKSLFLLGKQGFEEAGETLLKDCN